MSNPIVFDTISKEFAGTNRAAVRNVSLEVLEGHLVVLLGPSGCGKTTLLKMVNRLYEPTSGRILIDGVEVHTLKLTELRRRIGYVIQQVGLFPHMRIEKNIGVVPKMLGWEKRRISQRTDELLELVGLPPAEFRRRYPGQLSGGQQQRVGLARALAANPSIMLMDEPFAAIDNITRTRLQDELLRVQQTVRKTILFVTHDVEEAIKLADEIVIMQEGEVVQYDTPLNILSHPANDFVAQLTGANDLLRRLSLQPVATAMLPWTDEGRPITHKITPTTDLRTALGLLMSDNLEGLTVVDEAGHPVGYLTLAAIRNLTPRPSEETSGSAPSRHSTPDTQYLETDT
ncbi:MAG: ABC transporter ATP-binding protein [Chloroflexota bacterium]|nr:ABC transporter ATP-binding protein [Chloroflexota bacterium]